MRRRFYDLAVVDLLTILTMALTTTGIRNVVQMVLAVSLVLVLPGYTMVTALFPKRTLGVAEQLLFVLGLNLAVAALAGFILNLTPWGVRGESWAIFLGFVTLAASVVAFARRQPSALSKPWNIALGGRQALLFSLAALLTIGAVGVARSGAIQQPTTPFTQLWITPVDEASPSMVRLGVRNMELTTEHYTMQLKTGSTVMQEWTTIALAPGETWEVTVELENGQATPQLEAFLYRASEPNHVYRHGVLWHAPSN